jgi:hypothetical protein
MKKQRQHQEVRAGQHVEQGQHSEDGGVVLWLVDSWAQ